MTEQNDQNPQGPQHPEGPQNPESAGSESEPTTQAPLGGFGWTEAPPQDGQDAGGQDAGAEHTRTLPPFPPSSLSPSSLGPSGPAASGEPARGGRRGLAAAALAGALILGGAAGFGGAAAYDAWQGDDTTAVAATPSGAVTADTAANLPSGTAEKVAATVLPSVVKINVSGSSGSGSGSGIVLTADGAILTNNHVVELASSGGSMTVNFNDGTTVRASVVGTDPVTDIAVIQAEGVSGLTPATIGKSDDLKVGQSVVAVGSPYGLDATVTTGIVSALNRPVSVQSEQQQQSPFGFGEQQQQQAITSTTYPAIQTDAAINPGNSGGPLVDMSGRVVGINSSIRTSGDSLTGSGGSIGLGFAIPIDEVLPIVNQLRDGQDPTHARLAITVSDITTDTLAQGAVVQEVQSGGAADKAGLRKGDVITKVDDQLIDSSESLVATIRGHRPEEKVTLTFLRDGDTKTTTATLGSDAQTTES